jgi:hypothetical protein
MKIAVLTVIYAEMAGFMEEYIKCIQDQSCKDFDLVVISDRFPMSIEPFMKRAGVNAKVFEFSQSHLGNRLYGLKACRDLGYDIVVCSDSDETMFVDRIEKIVTFFSEHPEKKIVYNNSVARRGNKYFDLFYKERITLLDVLEFNVLGYGALNLRKDMIPFVLEHRNEHVLVFDWWLALVYLLRYGEVDFLKGVKNNYRAHPGNFVGPVLDIHRERVKLGIRVKKHHYSELARYCRENGFEDKVSIFTNQLAKVVEVEKFIVDTSLDYYIELVKNHFENREKMYWWQDVVSLDKCKGLAL